MGPVPVSSRWPRVAREAFPILVLLAVTVKLTAFEWRVRDLTLTDETAYVAFALRWAAGGEMSIEVGPLYLLWYRVLMQLPVPLPYLPFVNHGLLMAALSVFFYALLRRLGMGRGVAVAAAALLILNAHLVAIDPFPVHFATALLAVGVLVGTYRRSLVGACGPIGFAVLAASYVRPEFGGLLLVFCPLYVVGGAWWLRRGGSWHAFLAWALPLVLAVAGCWSVIGLPLPNGQRGMVAFAQHYGMNVAFHEHREGALVEDRAVRQDFGNVQTVGEAIVARPVRFARHVWWNVAKLPSSALRLIGPDLGLPWSLRAMLQLGVLVVLQRGMFALVRALRAGGLRGVEGQPLRATLLALAGVAVISVPSVLLIYPRDHYLLLPMFFILALAVSSLPAPRWPTGWLGAPERWKTRVAGVATAALVVGITPTPIYGWTLLQPLVRVQSTAPTHNREVLALLSSLPLRSPVVVVDFAEYGPMRALWTMPGASVIGHDKKAESIRQFVAKYDVGVIVLEPRLLTDPRYSGDAEFMGLWNETETGAFVVLSSPSGARVAVRRDLLGGD